MFLEVDLCGREQAVGDGQHPGFTITVAAAIDGDGFETEIDGDDMRA